MITSDYFIVCDQILGGTMGIVSFLPCKEARTLEHFNNIWNIPVLINTFDFCHIASENAMTMKLSTDCHQSNRALSGILENQKWSEVNILYDDILSEFYFI